MMHSSIRAWLTRLYPRPWRERYAVEFDAMLEQCLRSPLDVVDVMLGALEPTFNYWLEKMLPGD